MRCQTLFLLLSCLVVPANTETDDASTEDLTMAVDYLRNYGWAPEQRIGEPSEQVDRGSVKENIKEFQKFAGLQPTGKLDAETVTMMKKPRCGNKDKNGQNGATSGSRSKRFALGGSKWPSRYISYRMARYSEKLARDDVDRDMYKALGHWQKYADLDFYKATYDSPKVDIDISFMPRSHGDKDFDGPGGVLAHAFYPKHGGNIHMDEAEAWTLTTRGTNYLQVLVHEIGHSLGLGHSGVYGSVMLPFAQAYDPNFELNYDDIQGIQEIYGVNPNYNPGPTTTPVSSLDKTTKQPCSPVSNGRIDAATTTEDGTTYMFKDEFYMEVDASGIRPGFPKRIQQRWTDGPDRVDAVLSYPPKYRYEYDSAADSFRKIEEVPKQLYFFRGDRVYNYHGNSQTVESGFDMPIGDCFHGIPTNIDAAFRWSGNGETYFIKGDQYYLYNNTHNGEQQQIHHHLHNNHPGFLEPGYPKSLSLWKGLPDRIDAALQWENGKTYFFHNDVYYKFNDDEFKVEENAEYPRQTLNVWLKCEN